MLFKEFGSKDMPVIVLLHGGGLSWWSWKPQIDALQKDYRVIAPVIDGHGEAWDTDFVSIEKSAEQVINYINENCNGKVYALCGLSIGAQIVVEILFRESGIAEYALMESPLVYPMKITTALTVPVYNICYGLIKKRWFAKLQAKALNVPEKLFDRYYEDSSKMSKESLINITKSNGSYSMPPAVENTKARVLILVGGNELRIMKKSAALLHSTIKGSTLKVIERGGHGETSLVYPGKYIDLLKQLFMGL